MFLIIVKRLNRCKRYGFILLGLIYICPGLSQVKTSEPEIVLQDEKLAIRPADFYIERINDHRENETAVAWIVPAKLPSTPKAPAIPVDFRGGGINAIKKYINFSIPDNNAYHKIVITLTKFEAIEMPIANAQIEGHAALTFSFALEVNQEKNIPLSTYSSSAVYKRSIGSAQDIEPTLRHMLQNGLIYINNWMIKQADNNINLAKKVEVSFTDFAEKVENDTVYYNINRPLTWNDFQSNTPAAKYDALVFASIGYAEEVKVEKGVIEVQLNMKVFLPKSACWAKASGRSDYALNHEQRHFDIAKIIAERFKRKLRTEILPVGNYDGLINEDYLDAYREMDSMQEQYDNETSHGTNQGAQQEWNIKIDNELKQFGVK